MPGVLDKLSDRLDASNAPAVNRPERATFREFLDADARVPIGEGRDAPYSFTGREVLIGIVDTTDDILGREGGEPLHDSQLTLAGGAQWGKTIFELNLAAYCTAMRFLNFGLYLPDNDLASTVIDTKYRPEVVDQIPWLAEMTMVGKAVNKSGKQVNTKRAAMVTDGQRRATFMVSGLQKPATTITLDIAARDEEDDIPPANAKYVRGRMASSAYRIQFVIGTQRVHGRGQQKAWETGSQGVVLVGPQTEAWQYEPSQQVGEVPDRFINPEEEFPGVIRCAVDGTPKPTDPKLTWAGDFRHDHAPDITVATHNFRNVYYLGHPESGEPLDRFRPVWHHRKPERIEMRDWSYRVSQIDVGAIGIDQIVGRFQLAVEDPEEMTVFRCDVLGLPQSLSQALTPFVIDRAKAIDPYELRMIREPERAAFAGLDTGDKCWLWIREVEAADRKRLIYSASIPAGDLVKRIVALNEKHLWDCLLMDQRPLVSEAREIALALNGLNAVTHWPAAPGKTDKEAWVSMPGGLSWDGRNARWRGLKCAVVRFDHKKLGMGIGQHFDSFEQEGMTKWVPLVVTNREETIDRVVRELLTPDEGVNEHVAGQLRTEPAMLLPAGTLPIVEQVGRHLITGSERERNDNGTLGDYVDGCANHLLLADAYSALAELTGEMGRPVTGSIATIPMPRRGRAEGREVRV